MPGCRGLKAAEQSSCKISSCASFPKSRVTARLRATAELLDYKNRLTPGTKQIQWTGASVFEFFLQLISIRGFLFLLCFWEEFMTGNQTCVVSIWAQ